MKIFAIVKTTGSSRSAGSCSEIPHCKGSSLSISPQHSVYATNTSFSLTSAGCVEDSFEGNIFLVLLTHTHKHSGTQATISSEDL